MSIYGDVLVLFNELYEEFIVFEMLPKVVAGTTQTSGGRKIRGILLNVDGGTLGEYGDTLENVQVPTLFTRAVLKKDSYVLVKDDVEHIYKVIKDSKYKKQANMNIYILESVTGLDGSQSSDDTVPLRIKAYD